MTSDDLEQRPGVPPTQVDVARAAGVSRSTVAAAFSRSGVNLKESTRNRVFAVAESLGYRPNRFASVLSGGRSGFIGLVHADVDAGSQQKKLREVSARLNGSGFQTIAHEYFREGGGNAEGIVSLLLETRVEGAVCVGLPELFEDAQFELMRSAGIPVITVEGVRRPGIRHFQSDREHGFALLTRHLIETGHKRLCLLNRWSSKRRDERHSPHTVGALRGYRKTCEAYGLGSALAEERVFEGMRRSGTDAYVIGFEGMTEILKQKKRPDAVLCFNDSCAIGALAACSRAGVAVPGDIAVTGYDNDRQGEFSWAPLTTVGHNAAKIAELAFGGLNEGIRSARGEAAEDGPGSEPEETRVRGRLIVRESCGGNAARS